LVTEMDTRLEHIAHTYYCHNQVSWLG